jgi:3-oxoacyl-[acyl-carrier protein] reductase|tara:strand:+ start:69 stop:809 length:741 start_codon:yes stop_codon:yes gene_type:complete
MDLNLKEKVVLITGASRGIGKACAEVLAREGSTIIINYNKNKEAAEKLSQELGNKSIAIKADVSNKDEVKEMFLKIKEQFGKLDVLVNNAGILHDSLLMMIKESDYNQILDTNLKGTFLCMQNASKMMMKQKSGKIINISSIIGKNGNAGQTHYAASKAGIIGLTKSAAKELGMYGVTVNSVAPGFIDTDMTKSMKEELKQQLIGNIALKRIGTPEDIAKVVLFLSSDLSNYISGEVIGVDGCQVI